MFASILAVGCFPLSGFAQAPNSGEPAELTALRSQFAADFKAATEPLKARYIADLQSLLKRLMDDGDLAGATAVQNELTTLNVPGAAGKPVSVRFAGSRWKNSDDRVEFRPSGAYREEWGGHQYTGSWQPVSNTEVSVVRNDGNKYRFTISDDGTDIGRSDGVHWSPIK